MVDAVFGFIVLALLLIVVVVDIWDSPGCRNLRVRLKESLWGL